MGAAVEMEHRRGNAEAQQNCEITTVCSRIFGPTKVAAVEAFVYGDEVITETSGLRLRGLPRLVDGKFGCLERLPSGFWFQDAGASLQGFGHTASQSFSGSLCDRAGQCLVPTGRAWTRRMPDNWIQHVVLTTGQSNVRPERWAFDVAVVPTLFLPVSMFGSHLTVR